MREHMLYDIFHNPGHVLCAQEMEKDFCESLRNNYDSPDDSLVRDSAGVKRQIAKDSPQQRFLVVRGMEEGRSTAVAARTSYFEGLRRDWFVL